MKQGLIHLIEDNPDDIALTELALNKNLINNKLIVSRDGVDALDFLFAAGEHSNRNADIMPCLILLDLKLPKIDGHEVLRRIRKNEYYTIYSCRRLEHIYRKTGCYFKL